MRQWMIDAFAKAPFRGNPACVLEPFEVWPEDAWMQALAAENNQAETAFLVRTPDPARFGLRWFTPKLEVPLCGHATLASGHVLLAELGLPTQSVAFVTKSGELTVRRVADGYEMDFPADLPVRVDPPEGFAEALGAIPEEVWAGRYLIAVMEDEETVRELTPDISALAAFPAKGARGNVGVAAPARPGASYDVVSRFFAPGSGIAEDPATGSLHCILSPLFGEKLGRPRLKFYQAYPGRGGEMTCETFADRVRMTGAAVTVLEGRLRL